MFGFLPTVSVPFLISVIKKFGKIYYGRFLWADADRYMQAGKTGRGRGPWAVAHTPVRKQEEIGGRVRL